MKKNIFDIGPSWESGWSSDNKTKQDLSQKITKLPKEHKLHFAKEKRNGKIITIVKPFYLSKLELDKTLKTLRKSLATGGTSKDNSLEFQGEVQQKLKNCLLKLGFGLK
ncbi:MAG TPA: translation initiation factor [Epsilonproteobacteria bacterium]|nr:translation initiation factor [Campylobacterota bacterium]